MPKITRAQLPRLVTFGSNTSLVPSSERSQISSILVEKGSGKNKKEIEIFSDGELVDGVHPDQAEFIFNALVGGTGSMRADRSLGFADWVSTVADQYADEINLENLMKYDVVADFDKRGGKMVMPVEELVELCTSMANIARTSYERFPREQKSPQRRTSTEEEIEIEVEL